MKLIKKLLLVLLVTSIGFNANAAFVIKKEVASQTEVAKESNNNQSITTQSKKLTKVEKMATKLLTKKGDGAKISKALYIILALFGLGWLGMGILDNFNGSKWIISLVLYLLLWLPGFIYTLIKMKDYYN